MVLCGECAMCKAIEEQSSMNVVEIDAASNNRVDDIRQVIDEVQYSPAEGRFKVYIIDEVHMLSTSAFNALLKTLEEPPSYLIFILATTEAHIRFHLPFCRAASAMISNGFRWKQLRQDCGNY